MTLRDIIERCRALRVEEERQNGDTYSELVFYKEDMQEWHSIFSDILGPATKPAGVKPTKDHLRLTEDFGGIWPGQTLFKKEFDHVIIIAMFWPWGDDIHVTLKMARLELERCKALPSTRTEGVRFAGLRAVFRRSIF